MKFVLLEWFSTNQVLGAFISIGLNILISITGILPSAFLTVGTVEFFGFQTGLIILIIGETLGAIISFILYRKGIQKLSTLPTVNQFENKYLKKLKNAKGLLAFFMVFLLRILPFVPSGAVTLTAALSKMSLLAFSIASTIGKIPALFIEAYSVFHILNFKIEYQIGLIIFSVMLFLTYWLWKRNKHYHKKEQQP